MNHVKGQGFECAHLALSKVLPGFSMKDAPEKLSRPEFGEEIRDPFVRTGLDCALLGCYLSLMDNSEEERERIRDIYYAHLSFAGKIGAWMVGSETPARPESAFSKDAPHSEEAFRFFEDQVASLASLQDLEKTGKKAAFFNQLLIGAVLSDPALVRHGRIDGLAKC